MSLFFSFYLLHFLFNSFPYHLTNKGGEGLIPHSCHTFEVINKLAVKHNLHTDGHIHNSNTQLYECQGPLNSP